MAKKENTNGNGTSGVGDITTLRNILMGQQIDEYDGRFEHLEERVKDQEIAVQKKIQLLEKQIEDQTLQSQNDMLMRLTKLENLLLDTMQGVTSKVAKQRAEERRALGKMLLEMSKRFLE